MNKIVLIIGPTACGKTKLSLEVAKKLNAEIINADAVQIYKDVNVGTAKIKKEEQENIIHHMLDFNPLDNKYTVYDYQKKGRSILDKLISENKNVVIVGGTGLYIKALLYEYKFEEEDENREEFLEMSNESLKEKIDEIYPSNNININNRNRMVRFLNHYLKTNNIIKNNELKNKRKYEFEIIYLVPDRKKLYEKIDDRVDKMFEDGLLEEAKMLFESGKDTDSIIGYKELNMHFKNLITLEEAIELIKKNTRHYAKRQITFFNNQFEDAKCIDVDYDNFQSTINKAFKILNI